MSRKIVMPSLATTNVGVDYGTLTYTDVQTTITATPWDIEYVLKEATDEQLAAELLRRTGLGKELE
jgi:hypothetical protein